MNIYPRSQNGYTMIEVVMVLVIIGVLAAVAAKSIGSATETARFEETRQEMNKLALAITGDPSKISGGIRTDYGYIGDIGALPPDWDALVSNPGGYGTWDGPYIKDNISTGSDNYYKLDAWGSEYTSPSSNNFSSIGGPDTLTQLIAKSVDDLLHNKVSLNLRDLNYSPPGSANTDSVKVLIDYPDGSGGTAQKIIYPDNNGFIEADSIPIGIHTVRAVFIPQDDTIMQKINVNPGIGYHGEIQHFADIWQVDTSGSSSAMLVKVPGSDSLYGDCNGFLFWIQNNTGQQILVTDVTLTWAAPEAYYRYIKWDGDNVFNRNNPKAASGENVSFSSNKILLNGESIRIDFDLFRDQPTGGPKVDIDSATFTIDFSDGSQLMVTTGECP